MGSSGGRGRFPAFQSPPTSLRCIQREAEVGRWGRRRVSGREKGREGKKRERGDIGQKIDMSSARPPFLCVAVGRAHFRGTAVAGAREGPAPQPAPALGGGLSPGLSVSDCLGRGILGNGATSYPGFWDWGLQELLSESLILPLESAGPSEAGAQALPGSLG